MSEDWGHGPNEPVQVWTDVEIRAVLDLSGHGPHGRVDCICTRGKAWDTDHIIDLLKKQRQRGVFP